MRKSTTTNKFAVCGALTFQRLKETEHQQLGWDIRRNLTKINYRIHTDAIKTHL